MHANDTDPDGDSLNASRVAGPSHGALTLDANGSFSYTPAANYSGPESFTYKTTDGSLDSDVVTVAITVNAVNDAPVASNGTLAATENVAATGTLIATDVDSASLTYAIVANGTRGTATITNSATGAYAYTPNPGASGADTLTFRANDGTLDSNVATISVNITGAPLAVALVSPNGGERVFATRPTTIRWTVSGASSVDVELSRNGGTTYVPIAGWTGLAGSATSCVWTPAGPATSTARIRVTARPAFGTPVTDASDANFAISTATPTITVTSPNTAVVWSVGSPRTIQWNHNLGLGSFVRVELSRNAGGSWESSPPRFRMPPRHLAR